MNRAGPFFGFTASRLWQCQISVTRQLTLLHWRNRTAYCCSPAAAGTTASAANKVRRTGGRNVDWRKRFARQHVIAIRSEIYECCDGDRVVLHIPRHETFVYVLT